MVPRHRRRRVIYNDDADQQYVDHQEHFGYQVRDAASLIESRTSPTFDTHVDTYAWCLGNGADPPWGGNTRPLPFLGSHRRATDIIVEACHRRRMEVWGSLRMNDIHDCRREKLEDSDDPVKAQHPDWLIGTAEERSLPEQVTERYLWSAFNFARPEVREYRLAYIERTAKEHDLDGYELDFHRFAWNFPLGREREMAHLMTGLVRQARASLDSIGRSRGRPYTLAAHVFDSPEASLDLGLEAEVWLAEGLVDALVVGMGYTPYTLALERWLALGRRHGVPIYPSVNTNTFGGDWPRLHGRPVYHEALRAAAAYYWQAGADGLYLFNLFDQQSRRVGLDPGYIYAPLNEVGDPVALRGKDKLYAIQPSADRGFMQQSVEAAPLPIALDTKEHLLPLMMGPDASNHDARVRIRAWTTGGDRDTAVWFRLNNRLLAAARDGHWYEAPVPAGLLRAGENRLAIWCDREATSATPLVVHRVFVPVEYG